VLFAANACRRNDAILIYIHHHLCDRLSRGAAYLSAPACDDVLRDVTAAWQGKRKLKMIHTGDASIRRLSQMQTMLLPLPVFRARAEWLIAQVLVCSHSYLYELVYLAGGSQYRA